MNRRLRDLSLDALGDLPEPCRACVFWEAAGARRGAAPDPAAGHQAKQAWWQATQLEWGVPGKAVYADGGIVAFATFAPGAHYPTAVRLGRSSDDALLLATLWVHPEYRGAGLGRLLLQAVLRETQRRGCRALEAYADRRLRDGGGACMLGEDFLTAHGFVVLHDHPTTPLLRLDLRQTVRWQESLSAALEGVATALQRRERAPAPARAVPTGAGTPAGLV